MSLKTYFLFNWQKKWILIFSLDIWQWNMNYTLNSHINVRKISLMFFIWNLFHLEDLLHFRRKLITWSKPRYKVCCIYFASFYTMAFSKLCVLLCLTVWEGGHLLKDTICSVYLWVLFALDIWINIFQISLQFTCEFIVVS